MTQIGTFLLQLDRHPWHDIRRNGRPGILSGTAHQWDAMFPDATVHPKKQPLPDTEALLASNISSQTRHVWDCQPGRTANQAGGTRGGCLWGLAGAAVLFQSHGVSGI